MTAETKLLPAPLPAPLPVRMCEAIIASLPYPIVTVGGVMFITMIAVYVFFGTLNPVPGERIWESPLEIVGLQLLLAAMPSYLIMCFLGNVRAGKEIFASLGKLLPADESRQFDRYRSAGYWPLAMIVGLAFALSFNIGWGAIDFDPDSPIFALSLVIVIGQNFLWVVVAVVLFFVIVDSMMLNKLGRQVYINVYQLDDLNGFGRAALNGLLMVVGALTLTMLQSLDMDFRWSNYGNAMLVGVPAAIVLWLMPTLAVHRRIRQAKQDTLDKINDEIARCSPKLEGNELTRLNALLMRRENVASLRTWPLDLSQFSRFVFYVLIPPLAWIGAALVELGLDYYLQ